MAVIINDFEIVIEQQQEPPEGTGETAPPPSPETTGPPLTPMDIKDVFRQQMERFARIRAH